MDAEAQARLLARLEQIDRKLDEVLAFRDQVLEFVSAGLAKKALAAVKAKVKG